MKIVFSVFPVILFLLFLFLMDSFKLVIKKQIFYASVWGGACAFISYLVNSFLQESTSSAFDTLSRYLAPAVEEGLKSLFIFYLVRKKRIGFMVDAAIYGFAVGTGFALCENLFYVYSLPDTSIFTWIIRGFGTAVMHGGCTALFAILYIGAKSRDRMVAPMVFAGLGLTYVVHSLFNHFYIHPLIQTLAIMICLPVLFVLVFRYNENLLRDWMDLELSSEVELLKMIRQGRFSASRAGEYLMSLKDRFSGEVILDMYCYLQLYLEMSLKAKRNIMLRENGFPLIREEGINTKLAELKVLQKRIGPVGDIALSPLIRMNYRDIWKLNLLQ
ncbi:MAG: PrsW family glutamic-type intramembrane protease [Bacteroidales bacterium]|jgi:RsiW-degrading membrane proteinase PrsW (M82 family)|nr:PrsW family intramembrane metalloprotease [Bacteroidales bacterium]MDD2263333.1 PrsW family glutamic-type intramembrane protease [Bacteroidales bacterium]MDD2830877.1 PrsW family glutamic-type intramembrane protease [Bacteroidales bacterium]MDD3208076.1 PrsW family glutamic-type intramembrane protease [Bacteroidales bacterium]MDD3696417.1 PrsW family glutamic-type intramembrane protease [Bacteroidales bacterium]